MNKRSTPEKPEIARGIVLRGIRVLKRVLGIGAISAKPRPKPTQDQIVEAVMRVLQHGAVAERQGWMKEVQRVTTSTGPTSVRAQLLEYGQLKDRADKRKPQGLGGITYRQKNKRTKRAPRGQGRG